MLVSDWSSLRESSAHDTHCQSNLVDDLFTACIGSFLSSSDIIDALRREFKFPRDVTTASASPGLARDVEIIGEGTRNSKNKNMTGSVKTPTNQNKHDYELRQEEEEEELRNLVQFLRQLIDTMSHGMETNNGRNVQQTSHNYVIGESSRQQQQQQQQQEMDEETDLRLLDQLAAKLATPKENSVNNRNGFLNNVNRVGQKPTSDSVKQGAYEDPNLDLAEQVLDPRVGSDALKRVQDFKRFGDSPIYKYPYNEIPYPNNQKSSVFNRKLYLKKLNLDTDDSNPSTHERVSSLNDYLSGVIHKRPPVLDDDGGSEAQSAPYWGPLWQTWPLERQRFLINDRDKIANVESPTEEIPSVSEQKFDYQAARRNYLQKLLEDLEAKKYADSLLRGQGVDNQGDKIVRPILGRSKRTISDERIRNSAIYLQNRCCRGEGCSASELQNFCYGLLI